jgi:uncharacterized protein YifN (PemK superfamily)
MPLLYQPPAGSVVMCDYTGNNVPEMIKLRPVVIVAINAHNAGLVTVVPISTVEPMPLQNVHHELSENPLPNKAGTRSWVKCDMVSTVGLYRLDRIKDGKNPDGSRRYIVPRVSAADFTAIQAAVRAALNV